MIPSIRSSPLAGLRTASRPPQQMPERKDPEAAPLLADADAGLAVAPLPDAPAGKNMTLAGLRQLHARYVALKGSHDEAAMREREIVALDIRKLKLELEAQFPIHAAHAMEALAKGHHAQGLEALGIADGVCDGLIALYGIEDDQKADGVRRELLSQALDGWHVGREHAHDDPVRWLSQGIKGVKALEAQQLPAGIHPDALPPSLDILQTLAGESGATDAGGRFDSAGFRYTSWGTRHSLGTLVDTGLHYLTLSTPARDLGNWIQGGRDSGARYTVGAIIKFFASCTGAVSSIAAGLVAWGETIVANTVEAAVRLAGAAVVGLAGISAKAAGLVSERAAESGDRMLEHATRWARNISFLAKGKQELVPPWKVARAAELAELARFTGTTSADVRARGLPGNGKYRLATEDEIPESILARDAGSNGPQRGKVAKLRFDAASGRLIGDRTSDLLIGVYRQPDTGRFVLSFVGTQGRRPATFKSNLAQGMGIEDSAYAEAKAVVEAFVEEFGPDKVVLVGHSLGGGLATYAGIANGVRVTCFNSAGLHPLLRNRLGPDRIAAARVDHFNTSTDIVSQRLEARRLGLTAGSQVGNRYEIADSTGHSLKWAILRLDNP